MTKYRIVRFDDGQYGVQLRGLFFWTHRFVDIANPQGYTWSLIYVDNYCKGTKAQAERAAQSRFPSWVPA